MANPYFNNFNGNRFTFQNNLRFMPPILPPPPPPPALFSSNVRIVSDQDFVKSFKSKCEIVQSKKNPKVSLSKLKEKILSLNEAYSNIKEEERILNENINVYSDEEWQIAFEEIERNKTTINGILSEMSGAYLDLSRKAVAKRSAKRLRLKRLCLARKKEKIEMLKEREEKSRLIDENLKKINDDLQKAKQIEEAKQQADIVLKDVHRKRYEAKKNINKVDALVKLRKARQNTAKGRGENVCENDDTKFQEHVEKLKLLWVQKLAMYDSEESELRATLDHGKEKETSDDGEREVLGNLDKWHELLFGGVVAPQADFQGDVNKFVRIRCEWDRYISSTGTAIPTDWVLPAR